MSVVWKKMGALVNINNSSINTLWDIILHKFIFIVQDIIFIWLNSVFNK